MAADSLFFFLFFTSFVQLITCILRSRTRHFLQITRWARHCCCLCHGSKMPINIVKFTGVVYLNLIVGNEKYNLEMKCCWFCSISQLSIVKLKSYWRKKLMVCTPLYVLCVTCMHYILICMIMWKIWLKMDLRTLQFDFVIEVEGWATHLKKNVIIINKRSCCSVLTFNVFDKGSILRKQRREKWKAFIFLLLAVT